VGLRFVSLMSGGIDSPVATHLMLARGLEGTILHMDNGEFTGPDELEKVIEIARRLSELHPGQVRLVSAPHGIDLKAFAGYKNPRYMCILCKKAMLRVADGLCDRLGAEVIVMGDSIGQVASQTLANIAAVSLGIEHPIVRPLIGMDKVEIERTAKAIGTFHISIKRTAGCSAAPKYPVTRADPNRLEMASKEVGMDGTVSEVLRGIRDIDLR